MNTRTRNESEYHWTRRPVVWLGILSAAEVLGFIIWLIGAGMEVSDSFNPPEGTGSWYSEMVANASFFSWWTTFVAGMWLLVMILLWVNDEVSE